MILQAIKNALLTVTNNVYHFSAKNVTGNYIVWAEDGQGDSIWADDKIQEQAITGTIDYFTKTEYDPAFNEIQDALNTIDISYKLSSIQHEEVTGYTHYEWVWELG